MAHSTIEPTLEVDSRHDDLHTPDTPCLNDEGLKQALDAQYHKENPSPAYQTPEYPENDQLRRFKKRFFLLAAAFVLLFIVTIISIALAGTYGTRLHHSGACSLAASSTIPTNLSATAPNASCTFQIPDPTASNTTSLPTSDCSDLVSPYTPANLSGNFDIHCSGAVHSGGRPWILAIFVYKFEDCLSACASYNGADGSVHPNSTCFFANYYPNPTPGALTNCWLGAFDNVTVSGNGSVDSAVLLQ